MFKRFRRFAKWTKGARLYFLLAVVFSCINTYFDTVIPLLTTHLIDGVLLGESSPLSEPFVSWLQGDSIREGILMLAVGYLVFTFIRGIFIFSRRAVNAACSETIAYNMKNKLYSHLQTLSYPYYSSVDTGDLLQRCMTDVKTYKVFVSEKVVQFIRISSLVFFAVMQMLRFNVVMTLVTLTTAPIIFFASMKYYKVVKRVHKDVEEEEAKMTTTLQENLTNIRVVKAFGKEKRELDKFTRDSRAFGDESNRSVNYMAMFWAGTDFLIAIQFALTSIIGVKLTVDGVLTIGAFTAFLQYVAMVVFPMRQLGRLVGDLGKTTVAIERIDEVMAVASEFDENSDLRPAITGQVVFDRVGFKFENEAQKVIDDFSFEVSAGETVAIVGKTGSGKTTLMNLMTRLLDTTEGTIRYDGHDIRAIDKKWLRKHVGIVLQEPFLYSRSVYDNLKIMDPDLTESEVFNAADIASIHEEIHQFEKGYETLVGERGVTLSGGQVQRLAIARALMANKPILIFDDSLSAVDTETDLRIRKALNRHWEGTTVFLITHRITSAMEADKVVVLDQGRLVGSGTHEELITQEGLYRDLWEIQSKLEAEERYDNASREVIGYV